MRALIAVRVSPRPAENVRYSPELQESKCREWCLQNGHEVVTVVQDILVSGGDTKRFDSIFTALDQYEPTIVVVSDLSRWTRDRPSRFWAIKAILEDRGVQLASVEETWLGSDMPFTDTITTARVEANWMERETTRRKTSAGVRAAWVSGKRWGTPFGWTFDRHSRTWQIDKQRIGEFYRLWNLGTPAYQLEQQFGMHLNTARRSIQSKAQIDVVGEDVWLKAQNRPRVGRNDAYTASMYRGMLHCPFCGWVMIHMGSANWGRYRCDNRAQVPHPWWAFSTRLYVTPVVRDILERMVAPEDEVQLVARERLPKTELAVPDYQARLDRLSVAWANNRLSDEAYTRAVERVERERSTKVPVPPVSEQVEVVRQFRIVDLEQRDRGYGELVNRLLREVVEIVVNEDRSVSVGVKPPYDRWVRNK